MNSNKLCIMENVSLWRKVFKIVPIVSKLVKSIIDGISLAFYRT